MVFSKATVLLLAALAAVLLPAALATHCCQCSPKPCGSYLDGQTVKDYQGDSSQKGPGCSDYNTFFKTYNYCVQQGDGSGLCQETKTSNDVVLGHYCQAGGGGDPVLNDFTGSSFELVGEAGKWFNLISETTHNINIHLVSANMSSKANGGTVIDAIAMLYNDNKIETSVDEDGELTVAVNDQTITKDDLLKAGNNAAEVMLDDETAVVVELYRTEFGHSMHVITPVLDTTFFATTPGLDAYYQEYMRAYLNFFVGLVDPTVSGIHGLLGQTAPYSASSKPRTIVASSSAAIDLFHGEGEESDYIVDGPFATEYKFAQFGKAPVPTKQQVLKIARRSMIEQDKPTVFATMKMHA